MKQLSKILILLLLTALIVIPPMLAGAVNLSLARSAQNPAEASKYYEMAAKFLFWRSDLYEQAGLQAFADPPRAIQLLIKARQKGSLHPNGQLSLGDAYLNSGETDQAISEWENLLNGKQETGQISPRLALVYHAQGQIPDETRVLRQWLDFDKNNADASERLGRILAAEAAPEALPLLETAAAASPEAASRLAGLIATLKTSQTQPAYGLTLCGQALARLDEWPLAEQALLRAVEALPEYAPAWAWLGLARQHNQSANALEALERAIQLDGQSAPMHAMLGTYWQQSGNADKARTEFDIATKLEATNPAWWLALAEAESQSDLPAALTAYSQAIKLAPQDAGNWYALAAFCVENNVYLDDYGLNAALRAFALQPDNPAYMDMLGRAQMGLEDWTAAEVIFKKALEAQSASSGFIQHYHLGLLYLQTNRTSQAKFEFEQTAALDPQGPYGGQAKKLLERYFK